MNEDNPADARVAAALRGYAGGNATPGTPPPPTRVPDPGKRRPSTIGWLLYGVLLGLAAGVCAGLITLL